MLALIDQTKEPFVATAEEALIARDALTKLEPFAKRKTGIKIHVAGTRDVTVPIPARLLSLIVDFLKVVAERKPVSLIPFAAELTTQQAADFLNVSRPFFIKLLDRGEIPHRMVGTHRRVLMSDLLEYKARSDAARRKAIREMIAEAQKLGLP